MLPRYILVISIIFDPMKLKPTIFFLVLFALLAGGFNSVAQNTDTSSRVTDTIVRKRDTSEKEITGTGNSSLKDSSKPRKKDSLSATGSIRNDDAPVQTQKNATTGITIERSGASRPIEISSGISVNLIDSSELVPFRATTSSDSVLINTNKTTDKVLAANKMINTKDKGTYFLQEIRTPSGKEFVFYLLCIVLLILALFKTFYKMYFKYIL